jgi:hypothetical protein
MTRSTHRSRTRRSTSASGRRTLVSASPRYSASRPSTSTRRREQLVQELAHGRTDPAFGREQRRAKRGLGAGRLPQLQPGQEERSRHHVVQQLHLGRRAGRRFGAHRPDLGVGDVGDGRDQQRLLRGEVVQQRAPRQARAVLHPLRRRPGVAVLDEALDRGGEQPGAGVLPALLLGAGLPGRLVLRRARHGDILSSTNRPDGL